MADLNQWIRSPIGMGVVGGGVILLFLLLRLVFKRRPAPQEQLPASTKQLALEDPKQEEVETLPGRVEKIILTSNPQQVQIAQIAQDYPEMTVQLIRGWLREGRKTA